MAAYSISGWLERLLIWCASGVDLTFAAHLAAKSESECQILNSTRPLRRDANVRIGPLVSDDDRLRVGFLCRRILGSAAADLRYRKANKPAPRQFQHDFVVLQPFATFDRSKVSNKAEASIAHSSKRTVREPSHHANMHQRAKASILDSVIRLSGGFGESTCTGPASGRVPAGLVSLSPRRTRAWSRSSLSAPPPAHNVRPVRRVYQRYRSHISTRPPSHCGCGRRRRTRPIAGRLGR
jgi:hypothetical protein